MAPKQTAKKQLTEEQRKLADEFARWEAEREAEYQRARQEVDAFNAIPESERTHFYYPGDTYIASVTSEAVVANATKYELEMRARIRREHADYLANKRHDPVSSQDQVMDRSPKAIVRELIIQGRKLYNSSSRTVEIDMCQVAREMPDWTGIRYRGETEKDAARQQIHRAIKAYRKDWSWTKNIRPLIRSNAPFDL